MKTVMLGLSGGVDSAVAAILLKEAGYRVVCVFMRNWDSALNNDFLGNPNDKTKICPQELDYLDAKNVANKLDLEFQRVDFISEYWDLVFTKFVDEYKKGRTPNPDVLCNNEIKFSCFLNYAKSKGADFIATGHYAKIIVNDDIHLCKAYDKLKDQSYFLSGLSKKQLENVLFPLADLTKKQVRNIALEYNLDIALKKDSTGVCFIGERNFKEFLKNYIPAQSGLIKTFTTDIKDSTTIGTHQGVYYYTIGQRQGLDISSTGSPYFVIAKDTEQNILYVNQGECEYLYGNQVIISNLNILEKIEEIEYQVKFRYRSIETLCTIEILENSYAKLFLKTKVKAITPGQIAVVYKDDVLVLNGIIEEVYFDNKLRKYY